MQVLELLKIYIIINFMTYKIRILMLIKKNIKSIDVMSDHVNPFTNAGTIT